MATTNFVDEDTVVVADWLNDVDELVYTTYPAHSTAYTAHVAAYDAHITDYNTHVTTYDAHIANTSNPHSVTKAQVGLGNVTNDAQLKVASNLSDVASAATSRTNLDVYSTTESDNQAIAYAIALG